MRNAVVNYLFLEAPGGRICSKRNTVRLLIVRIHHLTAALLLTASVSSVLAQTTPDANAPQAQVDFYRSNIGHTGVASEKLTPPLSLLWRHTTSAAKNNPASPVYAAGIVYFASGGTLYAVSATDGTVRWKYPKEGKAQTYFATTPAISGGALYLTDDNGQVYRLDAATGQEIWRKKLEGAIRSAPVISSGVVYFGSGNNHCYALSADSGQVIWDAPTDGAVTTSPTITGGLAVFTSSDNNVYSLSARNGHKAWSVAFDADPSIVPIVFDGTSLYVTAGDTIYRLNPSNGAQEAPIKLPTNVLLPPTVSGDAIYVITQNNIVYALSGGRERWRAALDSAATAPPLLTGNLLLVPTQAGVISGYNAGSGKLQWRYVVQASATDSQPKAASTEVFAAPIVADGTLYVVSDDGTLSAFRADAPDDVPPQFTQFVPAAGATVRSADLAYGAFLVDDGTGINPATISLQVDGQTDAQAQYHAGLNAIYNTPTTALKEGAHQITVKATDWRGNATAQTWSFTVQDHPREDQPSLNPNGPNYPGRGGRNPNDPPPRRLSRRFNLLFSQGGTLAMEGLINQDAWLRLNALEFGALRLQSLLAAYGGDPAALFAATTSDWSERLPQLGAKRLAHLAAVRNMDIVQISVALEKSGARLVTIEDDTYPANLRQLPDAPPVLFVRGDLIPEDKFSIAIVGSRRATNYGLTLAFQFARDLAHHGLTIISGGARGVDTEAHRGALKAGGRTLAYLGCGVDIDYPRDNKRLFGEIADGHGAVLSEFPWERDLNPGVFPLGIDSSPGPVSGFWSLKARLTAAHLLPPAKRGSRDAMCSPSPAPSASVTTPVVTS